MTHDDQRRLRDEWWETPIDLSGNTGYVNSTALNYVKQMTPDDWHEIAASWNWGDGLEPLAWIVEQPNCDLATATVVFFLGEPSYYVYHGQEVLLGVNGDCGRMLLGIAARIRSGFYTSRLFDLDVVDRNFREGVRNDIEFLRKQNDPAWLVPDDLWALQRVRPHRPRYTYESSRFRFFFDGWLRRVAPKPDEA